MFVTWNFWLFVAVVLVVYYLIPGKWQNPLLLAASYGIYTYLEPRFVVLLAGLTLFNFWIVRRFTPETTRRRIYFWAAIIVNVAALALFKYALGVSTVVSPLLMKLGLVNEPFIVNLVLPLGISFYSFRALAYVFEVNNRQLEPERNLVDFALYIAFFPQIVSGPIVRPQSFISASKTPRKLSQQNLVDGLTFIFIGIFYKVAIADPLFSPVALTVPNVESLKSVDAWVELIRYTIRIYADFAGYSLLAIGVSTWFGMPILQNFRQPYFSRTVGEFWDRWHISLSTWIRDYIFYPVSRALLKRWGNQRAKTIQVVAFLLSMTLSGMWHGNGLKFALWGLLHGIYLSIERLFFPRARVKPKNAKWPQLLARAIVGTTVTLLAVSAAWVFFRAESITAAFAFFQRLVSSNPFPDMTPLLWIKILVPIALLLLIDLPQSLADSPLVIWKLRLGWRVMICTALLLALFIFGTQTNAPFIYAGF